MLFAASIPYMAEERERQATLDIIRPRVGFITEIMAIAEQKAEREARFLGQPIHGKRNK